MSSASVVSALPLLPLPWKKPPAPELPPNSTRGERDEYYRLCKIEKDAHARNPAVAIHKRLLRLNDDSDPKPGISICEEYIHAERTNPNWLAMQLTVVFFAMKARAQPAWGMYYSDLTEVQQVMRSLADCEKRAVIALIEGGVEPRRYFYQKTVESFDRL